MSKDNLKGTSAFNVERLTIWKYDEETGTYGEAKDFTGRTMTYKDTVTSTSTKLYGDGAIIDNVATVTGGNLTLKLAIDFQKEDRKDVLGEMYENGANLTTTNMIAPTLAVALQTRTSTGKINLRKWTRVQFAEPEESVQQKEDNSTFSTIELSGEYLPDENGVLRSRIDKIDEKQDAALIEQWFSKADYVYKEENVGS